MIYQALRNSSRMRLTYCLWATNDARVREPFDSREVKDLFTPERILQALPTGLWSAYRGKDNSNFCSCSRWITDY